jgi:hypothetical protein
MTTFFCADCGANLKERNAWWHKQRPYCLSCLVEQMRNMKDDENKDAKN